VFKIILTTAAIFVLLFSEATFGQGTPTHNATKATSKIGVAFSKAAIKALLNIRGNSNQELVDAAMIDLNVAASNNTELLIVHRISVFEQMYTINEMARQSEIAADIAVSRADPDHNPADPGAYEGHDETHDKDRACIVAWLPRLRALSSGIPKQCA
jgi:hypothetical protein